MRHWRTAHAVNKCGGPGNPSGVGVTNPGSANATDQYVPKHFPFPWFESLVIQSDRLLFHSEIANLDNAIQRSGPRSSERVKTTPAFSWITPEQLLRCARRDLRRKQPLRRIRPLRQPQIPARLDFPPTSPKRPPRLTTPVVSTLPICGLKYYIPLIEQSAAFKDGGLIDVTFDEANPPFANSSFNNANNPGNTAGAGVPATAAGYAQSDTAGESFNYQAPASSTSAERADRTEHASPRGTLNGNQVYPGPGDSAFIDRPASSQW